MSTFDTLAFAKQFFDAVEQGDIQTVENSYADNVVIWHNFDNVETSRADNVQTLQGMVKRIRDRHYAERRVNVFENGFVQRHVLRGVRTVDNVAVELYSCIICDLKDGKIVRLDEYLDSAQIAQFRKTAT